MEVGARGVVPLARRSQVGGFLVIFCTGNNLHCLPLEKKMEDAKKTEQKQN
jgi:hypothetical protein